MYSIISVHLHETFYQLSHYVAYSYLIQLFHELIYQFSQASSIYVLHKHKQTSLVQVTFIIADYIFMLQRFHYGYFHLNFVDSLGIL